MEKIFDPSYWERRKAEANQEHHAIFKCAREQWLRIEQKHREILRRHVSKYTSILDVGCGWGRLIDLMPSDWDASYLGVDICTSFIDKARGAHPEKLFVCGRVERMLEDFSYRTFDLAICVSIRPMVKRNVGDEAWRDIEIVLKRVARKILYLEYDPSDEGNLE